MAKKLPQETPAFTGKAERLIAQSTPRKLARQSAPEGAPNIVLILLDDVGFGSFGTFGGPVPTPTLDRIANIGPLVDSSMNIEAVGAFLRNESVRWQSIAKEIGVLPE